MDNTLIMLYITTPSVEKAKEIATILLEKQLIACATFWPCQSIYRWQGVVQNDSEVILIVKTTQEKYEIVQQEVTVHHPYQVPCIIKLDGQANMSYAKWVSDETCSQ